MAVINNGFDNSLTRNQMRKDNGENFNPIINGRSIRPPLRTIYLYSTAKRNFQVRHPLFPKLTLRGCENGERYVLCTSLPDPVPQACPDQERGGTRTDDNDAWIVSIDLLSPGNFTLDPYAGSSNPDFFANRNGGNLISEGLFPSLTNPPSEEEIRRAEDARDKHFKYLAKEASRLAAVSTKDLNEFLQQYPDTHIAMDSLGLQANWHTPNEVRQSCPNCGESIKQGVAFHQNAGVLCILDPQRAFKAGAISKDRYAELTEEPEKRGPGRPRNT